MSFTQADVKLGALVEEVPEGSPPLPARSPAEPGDRLSEKIARDSYSSVSKGQSNTTPVDSSPASPSDGDHKEVLEGISKGEMAEATPPHVVSNGIDSGKLYDDVKGKSKVDSPNQVPVSANIDKKMALPDADQIHDHNLRLAQRGFHLDTSNSPEAEPSRPGAFAVAGMGAQNDGDVASSVPSVVMDVENLPIAAELAEHGNLVEASKLEDVVVNYRSRKVRIGMSALFLVLTGIIIGGVIGAQKRKEDALDEALGECIVGDRTRLGNGQCDGNEYNTEKCNWDEGDCLLLNQYPDCALTPEQSAKLGDGICNGLPLFSPECDFDAGDCYGCMAPVDSLGDGRCDSIANTQKCGWDGGDCLDFHSKYPDCHVHWPSQIGNGYCDGGEYNTAECGWDGGDCLEFNEQYPGCHVDSLMRIGDGSCDGGDYNTEECGWDGGDCIEFNAQYPDCQVADPPYIGDDDCDGGDYNTKECGWDGGDCLDFNAQYPDCHVDNPTWIGDENCNGGEYNTEECGWDGGDCVVEGFPDCHAEFLNWIGDGGCKGGEYNTKECGWDGGDCLEFNAQYPDCQVADPSSIGNGSCDGGDYNTADCGWDGGDCLEFNEQYPDCHVGDTSYIGDGSCDGGNYNMAECGWDGGDCATRNTFLWKTYPDCVGVDPSWIGDGRCQGGNHNTVECGWDGGDCDATNANPWTSSPECKGSLPPDGSIGDGYCDGGDLNTAECGWDGGDCIVFNEQYPHCLVDNPNYVGDGDCDADEYDTAECGWDGGDCPHE